MVNVCVLHFDLYKLPKSNLTNANILCLVRVGSGRNKLVQLLIRSRNSGSRTVHAVDQPNRWAFRWQVNARGGRVVVRRAAGELFQMTGPARAELNY